MVYEVLINTHLVLRPTTESARVNSFKNTGIHLNDDQGQADLKQWIGLEGPENLSWTSMDALYDQDNAIVIYAVCTDGGTGVKWEATPVFAFVGRN